MRWIATGGIITMMANKFIFGEVPISQEKGHSMGAPNLSPPHKPAISPVIFECQPWPTIIRPAYFNLIPKSFHAVDYKGLYQ